MIVAIVGAPQAFASSGPSHGVTPNYSPCQITSWSQIALSSYPVGAYTIQDALQEEYDSSFNVWCGKFRTNTALWASSSNTTGGTITARVEACGGSWYGTSYSFPSGAFGPYHYASPTVNSAGGAESGYVLQAGSLYASDYSQCYSG